MRTCYLSPILNDVIALAKKADALNKLRISFLNSGRHEEAIRYYDAAIESNPKDSAPWINRRMSWKIKKIR
jgi:tetratricopeptide (TPR) repeat protein